MYDKKYDKFSQYTTLTSLHKCDWQSNLSGTHNNTQGGQSVWESRSAADLKKKIKLQQILYIQYTDLFGYFAQSCIFFPFDFSFGSPAQSKTQKKCALPHHLFFPSLRHRTSTHTHLYTQSFTKL